MIKEENIKPIAIAIYNIAYIPLVTVNVSNFLYTLPVSPKNDIVNTTLHTAPTQPNSVNTPPHKLHNSMI